MTETGGDRTDLDAELLEAARLSEVGDEAEALTILLELEEKHPDDPTLLCMIGALAETLGAEGMAVDYFIRCLSQDPTDIEILLTAGAGLAAARDPGAEPALRLAALTAPGYAAARMHYGALLIRSGLLDQGLEELLIARGLDPSDALVRRELGVAHLLRGSTGEAVEELEAAVAADPEDPGARLVLGLVLIQEDELSRAADELHPLAEAVSEDGNVQLILALLFGSQGWEEEAWLALTRAESIEPPMDAASIREVEEALGTDEDAMRQLLVDELAPMALRDRLYLD